MASVKVAVRARPFNQREIDMKSSEIIQMEGNKTSIENMKVSPQGGSEELGRERIKEFTFDYSYWSVNSRDPHFATQEQVFNDLGQEVVDNAFEGYNACIFAYGQTGSGKTFTMMGSADNEGLIPRICQAMYTRMKLGQNSGTTFRTEVSYLEIYNEKVKDLLKRESTQHNLRVREHPKLGPYVQDLSRHLVMDYSDVEELMARGNAHRTTASTAMNDVSSRSHAIFTLNFTQAKFIRDLPSETVSKVNLVDLAGSERADSTKATGQRLKEGGHINKSLVTLGTVISALAELSTSHSKKRVFIPYRDSVLTWLLRDSLGGNSKTIMIATISPAECNYGETLSTLRYANRAKNIINKPTINEDPNVKLIKELRDEIARLRLRIGGDDSSTQVMEKLQENEARVKILTDEWTEKWKETHKILKEQKTLGLRMSGQGVVLDSERPHLIGLGDDILSTGVVLYHLKDGRTSIGTENAETKQDIVLSGSGIQDEHCFIDLVDGGATLYPNPNSECCINAVPVDKPTRLTQGCVVLLGSTNVLRYNDPAEVHKLRKEKERRSLVNLSHLSFLSRSGGDMSKSTESIWGNGYESHEDGAEKTVDLSLRKLMESQSGGPLAEEQVPGSPLSKEQEAVEAQLSQKREELRQLQEKTEALKRMADEAHRKAEEEQTKLEKVTEELRRHLEKQASEEQGSAKRIVQLQQELRYLTAKEKEVRENFEQLKNRLQQERVYLLGKLETEQSRLYDEIKSLEMKEHDLQEAISRQQQELARVQEEVLLKREECSSQTNLLQDEIQLLRGELELSTSQASENWRSLLSLISGARDDLPLPKNTGDLENIVESIRQQLADRKQAQLAEIHEERQSIAGQMEALAEKQKLLQSFEASPEEDDGSGDTAETKKRGKTPSSEETGGGDNKMTSESSDEDGEEVSTLVKGRLAFVGEEVRKLQEEEQALGRKEDDVEVGWRHNLDTLDSLLPLLESMVEDLDKLEGCISEKEQDVAEIESAAHQSDTKLKGVITEKENLEQQLQKVQDRKADADTEQKELKTSLVTLDDKMAFLAQQEEDILGTLEEQRQRLEEELSKFGNGNGDPLLDAINGGSQMSSPTHNEAFLLSRPDNFGPLTSSPISSSALSNKLHHSSWDLQGLEEKYLVVERELEARRQAFESERGSDADNVHLKQLRQMEFQHREQLLELIKEKADNLKMHSSVRPTPPYCDLNPTLPGRRQNITSRSLPILPTHPYISFERGTEDCPIRISIPSYTLRGSGSNAHIEYEVKVVVMDDNWTLYRRYKRFRELHEYMKLKYGNRLQLPYFPPKLLFGNKSQRLVEERRKMLEVYLIELVNSCRRDLSCPLNRNVQGLCKQHMWEFAPFFRKGCFETSKHSTG